MNLDLLNNFVNPWEAGGALASQAVETPVLEGNVLEEFSPLPTASEVVATFYGSWRDERLTEYIWKKSDAPLPTDILALILQGALFQGLYKIDDTDLYDSQGNPTTREAVLQYRKKNWGGQPFPLALSIKGKDLKKIISEKGNVTIQLRSIFHDDAGNNLGHSGGYAERGRLKSQAVQGLNATQGFHYWPVWFVHNSPFGKMFRALVAEGNGGRDSWTGELMTDAEKIAMTLDGVLELLTLGTNVKDALINQAANLFIGLVEKKIINPGLTPYQLNILKKAYEIYKSATEKGLGENGKPDPMLEKYAKVELVANLIQVGLIVYQNGNFSFASSKNSTEGEPYHSIVKKYTIMYEEA